MGCIWIAVEAGPTEESLPQNAYFSLGHVAFAFHCLGPFMGPD